MMERNIGLNIKRLHKNNEDELRQIRTFINDVFREHSDLNIGMHSSISSKLHKDIYVIENDKEILLAASTHKSSWHPNCIYVQLAYNFGCANEKVLQSIISELMSKYDEPLFFLLDDRFYNVHKILSHNHFKMIRKTEIIHIHPTQEGGKTVPDERILSIKELRNNETRMNSFVQLCKKTYTETHLDNPVANLPIESWREAALDGVLEEHSYVIVHGLEINSFSLLYASDENSWELGWVGVDDLSRISDLDQLIHKQLEDAVMNNIAFIEKEVDSTCPYSLHICDSVVHEVAETLYAYMK